MDLEKHERGERAGRDSAKKHEREERARGFGGRTVNQDELKFWVRSYGSLPVCEMQPTVIHITAGFYYQPVVIIYITVGLFENPTVIAFFFLRTDSDAFISVGFKIPIVIGSTVIAYSVIVL